ncbi:hypothetical protein SGPA1_60133 [Streptomyces misionensis JCM 4497]
MNGPNGLWVSGRSPAGVSWRHARPSRQTRTALVRHSGHRVTHEAQSDTSRHTAGGGAERFGNAGRGGTGRTAVTVGSSLGQGLRACPGNGNVGRSGGPAEGTGRHRNIPKASRSLKTFRSTD